MHEDCVRAGGQAVVEALTSTRQTVATAESLTGGRVAAEITSVPGASACFLGGVVAYDTAVKVQLLGVPADVVRRHGVVSEECAVAMASGVRELLGTTWGVATTGVAGPERQEGKPVGTVFVAVSGPKGRRVLDLRLDGDRSAVQEATVTAVLDLLRETVTTSESTSAESAERA